MSKDWPLFKFRTTNRFIEIKARDLSTAKEIVQKYLKPGEIIFEIKQRVKNPMAIIPYSKSLKIVNLEQLTHGTGARYLEVMPDNIH